jgi:hypothetical protein
MKTMNDYRNLDRDAAFDLLFSRATIQDVLARYCRALDRCDIELLKSTFWPDGHDDHGMFVGNISDFADFSMATLRTMDRTMHLIANCVIDFDDPDHAHSETYVAAWHDIPHDLGATHIVAGGRYLDRFERRSGEWRIFERVFVADWHQIQHSTANLENALSAQITKRGGRFPDDPAFGFLSPLATNIKSAELAG